MNWCLTWQLALVNQLLFLDSAERVNFDFCALGMTIKENDMPTPVRKRTSVVTNSKRLSQALKRKQCTGDHTHANTMGGKIKQCQVYPPAFCELVCREVSAERSQGGTHINAIDATLEINALMSVCGHPSPHAGEDPGIWAEELYAGREFFDDVTGHSLNHGLAVEARKLEMQFFRKMGVYTKVPRSEATSHGRRVITMGTTCV